MKAYENKNTIDGMVHSAPHEYYGLIPNYFSIERLIFYGATTFRFVSAPTFKLFFVLILVYGCIIARFQDTVIDNNEVICIW